MTEDLNRIDSIIVRYLTGAADRNEKEELLSWLKESESNKEYFFSHKATWDATRINTDSGTHRAWMRINDKINKESPIRKIRFAKWFKYAAAVILLAGMGTSLYFALKNPARKPQTIIYTEIRTMEGQKKEVTLTDGTKVWLNSGTFFRYPDNYGKRNREVYLQGEAYFEVKRDTTKTFVVLTDNITIKVLGTSFNVNCYPDLDQVETTVISGIVSIENSGSEKDKDVVILNKQEKGTFLKDRKKILIQSSNNLTSTVTPLGFKKIALNGEETGNTVSWKDRTLVFDNETFEEMAVKLHRWFNVDIIIRDENLKNYRYKGKFDDVRNVFQVLEVIKLTTPIAYEYNEKTREITIERINK
jgi:ferric-dicitrate binding protein FerR (iron transport regulator)